MDLDDFQAWAGTKSNGEIPLETRLTVAVLGLAGESGEVADLYKKIVGQGHEFDQAALINEAGDVLWYLAELATVLGLPLSQIAWANREKLDRRYPNGFEPALSVGRAN